MNEACIKASFAQIKHSISHIKDIKEDTDLRKNMIHSEKYNLSEPI